MEHLSIAVSCISLTKAVAGTSLSLGTFVRRCLEARRDLDAISQELTSLMNTLELLTQDLGSAKTQIPQPLQEGLETVVSSCHNVLAELDELLKKQQNGGNATWVVTGRPDALRLRSTLETHRGALKLAVALLKV
jgi:Fungal N-terminal domain of STAND proteins